MHSKFAVIIALVFINLTQSLAEEDSRDLKDIPIVDKFMGVLQTLPGASGFKPTESNTIAPEVSVTLGSGTSLGSSTTPYRICSCDHQSDDFCSAAATSTDTEQNGVDTSW